jgi:alkaline phosphatase D
MGDRFTRQGQRVQVILLDTRYFRSPLKKLPLAQALVGGRYTASDDTSTTMLGEAQWAWLEKTLREPAELRLIVTSIEFAAEQQGFESWANLPHEQQRMIDVLKHTQAQGVLFLSGDRHWCELSRIDGPGYPLYDLTASSMTQKHPRGTPTKNKNRVLPKTYHLPNVGTMNIDWQADPLITMKIIDLEGNPQLEQTLRLSELKAKP